MTFKNCSFSGTQGIQHQNVEFQGRIENCQLFGSGVGNALNVTGPGSIVKGAIVNCALIGPASGLAINVGTGKVDLIGCAFDETDVSVLAGGELFSWQHNRTNQTEVFIGASTTIDSSFTSVIHADTFAWDWTQADDWDIAGAERNRFQSENLDQFQISHDDTPGGFTAGLVITGGTSTATGTVLRADSSIVVYTPLTGTFQDAETITDTGSGSATSTSAPSAVAHLKSVFIPVIPLATSYLKYRGDASNVQVQGYELDQVTKTVLNTTFIASGDDFEATIVGDATTAFIQWQVESDTVNQQFYDIEVRETDSSGNFIFNEDLLNHYFWANGFDMLNNQMESSGVATNFVYFGESDNDMYDATMQITDSTPSPAGWAIAVQNFLNGFEVLITSDTVLIETVIDGGFAVIYSATTANGDTGPTQTLSTLIAAASVSSPLEFRVRWNDPNQNDEGSFEVFVGGFKIEFGDWNVDGGANVGGASGTEDYVVNTLYSEGSIGYPANSTWDDVVVETFGLCVQNANLTLAAGVIVTTASGGRTKLKNVTANATAASFPVEPGGELILEETSLLGTTITSPIDGVLNFNCPKDVNGVNVLKTTGDIIWDLGGQLILNGLFLEHTDPTQEYSMITDNSLVNPPIVGRGIRLPGVRPRLRRIDKLGDVYELDSTKEIIQSGPEPEHELRFDVDENYGRDVNRLTPTGHEHREVTITFLTIRDMCLFDKLQEWADEEAQIEFIYPRGILYGYKVRIVAGSRRVQGNNMDRVNFAAEFVEFN